MEYPMKSVINMLQMAHQLELKEFVLSFKILSIRVLLALLMLISGLLGIVTLVLFVNQVALVLLE